MSKLKRRMMDHVQNWNIRIYAFSILHVCANNFANDTWIINDQTVSNFFFLFLKLYPDEKHNFGVYFLKIDFSYKAPGIDILIWSGI